MAGSAFSRATGSDVVVDASGDLQVSSWLKDMTHTPSGYRQVHHMSVELTISYPDLVITDANARMYNHPFAQCPMATTGIKRLIGLPVGEGFSRAVKERIGLEQGCTHLVTLVQQAAAVTALSHVGVGVLNGTIESPTEETDDFYRRVHAAEPDVIGSCHVWAADGPMVHRLSLKTSAPDEPRGDPA